MFVKKPDQEIRPGADLPIQQEDIMASKINWEAIGVLVAVISGAAAVGAWVQVTQSTAVKLSGEIGELQKRSDQADKVLNHVKLECVTVPSSGNVAVCKEGYVVTGCSAGQNRGSIHHSPEENACRTPGPPVDWTQARCCRVVKE
jgi:resistin